MISFALVVIGVIAGGLSNSIIVLGVFLILAGAANWMETEWLHSHIHKVVNQEEDDDSDPIN